MLFCPAWDGFSSESILYVITYHEKPKENINHPRLFKLGERNDRHPVC